MSAIEPAPDHYIRYCARMALQGGDSSLSIDPEADAGNVMSLEAGRTRRATAQLMRGREV